MCEISDHEYFLLEREKYETSFLLYYYNIDSGEKIFIKKNISAIKKLNDIYIIDCWSNKQLQYKMTKEEILAGKFKVSKIYMWNKHFYLKDNFYLEVNSGSESIIELIKIKNRSPCIYKTINFDNHVYSLCLLKNGNYAILSGNSEPLIIVLDKEFKIINTLYLEKINDRHLYYYEMLKIEELDNKNILLHNNNSAMIMDINNGKIIHDESIYKGNEDIILHLFKNDKLMYLNDSQIIKIYNVSNDITYLEKFISLENRKVDIRYMNYINNEILLLYEDGYISKIKYYPCKPIKMNKIYDLFYKFN